MAEPTPTEPNAQNTNTTEQQTIGNSTDASVTPMKSTISSRVRRLQFWFAGATVVILLVIFLSFTFSNKITAFFESEDRYAYVWVPITVIAVITLLIWYIPKLQVTRLIKKSLTAKESDFALEKDEIKLEDDIRKTVAQVIGGLFLIAGLIVTYNTYRLGLEQQRITIRGQITERFNKAVDHLGNQDIAVRLGGLYALEQILKESPEDRGSIIEILSAYVRGAPAEKDASAVKGSEDRRCKTLEEIHPISVDRQAALTIIGRKSEIPNDVSFPVNFGSSNLNRAIFTKGDFRGTSFLKANLSFARMDNSLLEDSNFTHAFSCRDETSDETESKGEVNFSGAKLKGSKFAYASLSSASFKDADLSGVDLRNADLTNAVLAGSDLKGVRLSGTGLNGANLSNVKNLDPNELMLAKFDFVFCSDMRSDEGTILQKYPRQSAIDFFSPRNSR